MLWWNTKSLLKKTARFNKLTLMIKTKITDEVLLRHLASLKEDKREIFLIADGQARVYAASCTEMVNQMRANHRLGLLESYVLAQGYVAGALLSATVKGDDRIQLNIECGGPIKGLNIEAWACGAVRGYLAANPIPLEKPLTTLDTSLLYGPGFLSISKILEGAKTPFTGQIMLEHGNLAEDLAEYYRQSEQTPTLFYISLDYDHEGRITGAGGIFIQALPGCSDEVLGKLQDKSHALPNLAKFIAAGGDVKDYVEDNFSEYGVEHLEKAMLGFSCPCRRETFEKYLATLPQDEKKAILEGQFPLEVECFNCGTTYSFDKKEITDLFANGGTR